MDGLTQQRHTFLLQLLLKSFSPTPSGNSASNAQLPASETRPDQPRRGSGCYTGSCCPHGAVYRVLSGCGCRLLQLLQSNRLLLCLFRSRNPLLVFARACWSRSYSASMAHPSSYLSTICMSQTLWSRGPGSFKTAATFGPSTPWRSHVASLMCSATSSTKAICAALPARFKRHGWCRLDRLDAMRLGVRVVQ